MTTKHLHCSSQCQCQCFSPTFFQGSLRLLPLNYLLMDLKEFQLVIVIQLKYPSILFKTNCQVSAKLMGGFEIFLIIKFENTNQLC